MFRSIRKQSVVGRFGSNTKLFAIVLGIAGLVTGANAHAQFVVNGPDGSLGIANPNGGYDFFYPERMNPFANIPIPGSTKITPNGPIWLGLDGKIHGNLQDPLTGDMHFRRANPNAGASGRNPSGGVQRLQPQPVAPRQRVVNPPRVPSNRATVPYRGPATRTTYRTR
jgi:hypothetical protein